MHYPKIIPTAISLLLVVGCATPTRRVSQQSKDRVAAGNSEAIPRPVLRNRISGLSINIDPAKRTRNTNFGNGDVASVSTSRLIDMRYMLDMYEHNSKAKQVSDVLNTRDMSIRECYSDRVTDTPGLKGTLTFAFRLSKMNPGLHAVQRTGGTIRDSSLVTCIAAELQRMPVATYVSGRGELRYSFNVINQKQSVESIAAETR